MLNTFKTVDMAAKLDYEQMVKDQAAEITRLLRENRSQAKSIRGYKGLSSRGGLDRVQENPLRTGHNYVEPVNTPTPEHWVGPWQKYCADCGGINPDFKDETECQDCHMHLGAVEVAEKLKACPNCGSKKAKKLG